MDSDDFHDYAIIGSALIFDSGCDFPQWSQKMIDEFGDELIPYLEEIFKASKTHLDMVIDNAVSEELKGSNPSNLNSDSEEG